MEKTGVTISLAILVLFGSNTSYGQADRPPFKSALPKYTFSTTLEKQEQELKSNPMVQRFAESRKKLSVDPYMPIYHYSGPDGRQAPCTSVRPSREDSKGVSIRTQGGDAELISQNAWQMKSIY